VGEYILGYFKILEDNRRLLIVLEESYNIPHRIKRVFCTINIARIINNV